MLNKMKQKPQIKIKTMYIYTEIVPNAVPYVLDLSKEDVSDEEIAICLYEQIYGGFK